MGDRSSARRHSPYTRLRLGLSRDGPIYLIHPLVQIYDDVAIALPMLSNCCNHKFHCDSSAGKLRKYASVLEMAVLSWLFQEVRLLTEGMRFRRFRRFRSSIFVHDFSLRCLFVSNACFLEWRPKRNLLALCRLPKALQRDLSPFLQVNNSMSATFKCIESPLPALRFYNSSRVL